jgi:hypothetical protein
VKIVSLAALLSAFFFAGCAAGGGAPLGGSFGTMSNSAQSSGSTPCPAGSVYQNGQCVAYGGAKH